MPICHALHDPWRALHNWPLLPNTVLSGLAPMDTEGSTHRTPSELAAEIREDLERPLNPHQRGRVPTIHKYLLMQLIINSHPVPFKKH